MEKKIKEIIKEIEPVLRSHGGGLEFVSFDQKRGVLKVKMLGQCAGCPLARITLKDGIEREIKGKLPEVKTVEAV